MTFEGTEKLKEYRSAPTSAAVTARVEVPERYEPGSDQALHPMITEWFEGIGHCLAEAVAGGGRRWTVQRTVFIVAFFLE